MQSGNPYQKRTYHTLSLLQLSLTPTTVSYEPTTTHSIVDYLDYVTTGQQELLTLIGLEHKGDLASPKDMSWTPISYSLVTLQFKQRITRPATYETSYL